MSYQHKIEAGQKVAQIKLANVVNEGKTWYVSSTSALARDKRDAGSVNTPFATLAYALTVTKVAAGDIIRVLANHAETLTAAAAITISKAGITIIGVGNGRARPTFTWSTAAAAQWIISGANVLIRNCYFNFCGTAALAITAAFSVTGADLTFDSCHFQGNTSDTGVAVGILTAATATRFAMRNCRWFGTAAGSQSSTAAIQHESGADFDISDNDFRGRASQFILNTATVLGGRIHNNRMANSGANVVIVLAAGTTPFITNNRINVPAGTAPITAAGGLVAGNVYSVGAGVTAGTASTF